MDLKEASVTLRYISDLTSVTTPHPTLCPTDFPHITYSTRLSMLLWRLRLHITAGLAVFKTAGNLNRHFEFR